MTDMWPRLGRIWLRALLPGMALALGLFGLQIGAFVALGTITDGFDRGWPAAEAVAFVAGPVLGHALFVTLLTDQLVRNSWRPRWAGVRAGIVLAAPILLFAALDLLGGSYGCADGQVTERSVVPMWPWLWIGWLLLTLGAVPARLLGHSSGAMLRWPERAVLLAPFALVILVTGLPFQRRVINCTPPFDGMGVMEGGLVGLPLLALFLFSMAFALALLSAAVVQTQAESPAR